MSNSTKTIVLSDRSNRHLRRWAKGRMANTASPLPGGFWLVPVDDEIVARINELRITGESDDQVVWRMMREAFSEGIDK
ncbi:MAG: hypothetical protein L3K26_00310 [Candidatus Hydrogenedentes bacterium]|nr:hypothetical protein [Candidatus Hydrogenedentota bacterium]